MPIDKHIGVDACKAGWFLIAIGPGEELEFGIFTTIEKLWRTYSEARFILIDIPIGLPSKEIKTRPCDKAARQVLSPKRHHSIFSPPCREALAAKSYRHACRINHNVCNRKISQQAWHISRKIKEVDDLMTTHPAAHDIVKETHPEVCFWALAHKEPMVHYKKSPEGGAERYAVLKKYFGKSSAVIKSALDRYPRKQLAYDDILDAMVNAVTAARLDASMEMLPPEPIRDMLVLPMQMVYSPSDW
jgi:predicted RNase H-like nuclease